MKKKIPEFQSEEEEREFWSKADSTEYVDWSKAKRAISEPEADAADHLRTSGMCHINR